MTDPVEPTEVELARLRRLADRLLAARSAEASGTSPRRLRAGRGLEPFDLAPWTPRDDPRTLDARATARAGRPIARRRQDESFATAMLCLDRSASMAVRDAEKWRLARQVTAALGYLLLAGGHRVGLVVFSDGPDVVLPATRGRAAFVRLRRQLALTAPRAAGGGSELARCAPLVPPLATAVVVSDFLTPDFLRGGIDALVARRAAPRIVQVTSPDDARLEVATGPVRVRDVESGEGRVVLCDAATTAAVADRLEAHGDALLRHCAHLGIPATRASTAAGWRDAVVSHVRAVCGAHA